MGRIAVAAIVAIWVIPISLLVNRIVPEPYMDEIFHIPQAQQYCRGNFKSWDPMITTPPGLYFLSLAYVASFFPGMWFTKAASSLSELCSTGILRSANGAMTVICSVLLYDILVHLRPYLGKSRATIYAVIMSLYPVHWFFAFLYYTDVASVTIVLAMHLASLKKSYWISAILGAFAIFIRQTNVIWMLFVASISVIDYTEALFGDLDVQLDGHKISDAKDGVEAYKESIPMPLKLRRRKAGSSMNATKPIILETSDCSSSDAPDLIGELQSTFPKVWCLKWKILVLFAPFMILLVAFMTFVIWNGSIVLGAKEAHVASPHFSQLMYFGLVSAAATAPAHFSLSQVVYICRSFRKKKLLSLFQWSMALILGFIIVQFFSIAHPYLIADNRHYTFYFWRKIIKAHWMMKYLLVPVYVFSWFSILTLLGKTQKKFWVLLFFFACAAVLVPAPLIEFRYYTAPILVLILHSRIDDKSSWIIMAILYVAVDIFTMAMFLFRPFSWAHEPGIQRFIW